MVLPMDEGTQSAADYRGEAIEAERFPKLFENIVLRQDGEWPEG